MKESVRQSDTRDCASSNCIMNELPSKVDLQLTSSPVAVQFGGGGGSPRVALHRSRNATAGVRPTSKFRRY